MINILDQIGDKHHAFGIHLLNDGNGAIVAGIDPGDGVANILTEIVRKWRGGVGKRPITWGTLASVLDTIKLRILAKDIRDALRGGECAQLCKLTQSVKEHTFIMCRPHNLSRRCGKWQGSSATWPSWYVSH